MFKKRSLSRLLTLAEASQAPDTKVFWSGERERDMTSPVWPAKVVTCWPVSMSHKTLKNQPSCSVQWKSRLCNRFVQLIPKRTTQNIVDLAVLWIKMWIFKPDPIMICIRHRFDAHFPTLLYFFDINTKFSYTTKKWEKALTMSYHHCWWESDCRPGTCSSWDSRCGRAAPGTRAPPRLGS